METLRSELTKKINAKVEHDKKFYGYNNKNFLKRWDSPFKSRFGIPQGKYSLSAKKVYNESNARLEKALIKQHRLEKIGE